MSEKTELPSAVRDSDIVDNVSIVARSSEADSNLGTSGDENETRGDKARATKQGCSKLTESF